jgi:hypothetical protein
MKVSFSQLEEARRNPARFKRRQAASKGFFNNKNFRAYFVAAMKRFHQGGTKPQVVKFFRDKCVANLDKQLNFNSRLNNYLGVLAGYCDSYSAQGCVFVEARKVVGLALGSHTLTGTLQRFDVRASGGYRGTLTQMEQTDWQKELRWPLIQKAIADDLLCPSSEVEVGIFSLDTGLYGYNIFTEKQINDAEQEALSLLGVVESTPI